MNVKLTKRKAWELISRIQPRLNIKQEATPSDVAMCCGQMAPKPLFPVALVIHTTTTPGSVPLW